MMELDQKVCSPKLAKRLKELGVKQESIFVWEYHDDQCHAVKYIPYAVVPNEFNKFQLYSAFTVAELMDMLPAFIDIGHEEPFNNFYLRIEKRMPENIKYIAVYVCDTMPGEHIGNPAYEVRSQLKHYDSNLAECLGNLLVCLYEKGFIKC